MLDVCAVFPAHISWTTSSQWKVRNDALVSTYGIA